MLHFKRPVTQSYSVPDWYMSATVLEVSRHQHLLLNVLISYPSENSVFFSSVCCQYVLLVPVLSMPAVNTSLSYGRGAERHPLYMLAS